MGLVDLAEFKDYVGVETDADDAVLQELLDRVEAVFLAQVGRVDRPFGPAQTARVEVKDGTGSPRLWLDYPISALTVTVKLGNDATAWDEELDPTDATVLTFRAGNRRIARLDGGRFGCQGAPDYVTVTYNAAADEPEDVKLAITRMAKALYEESGRPEATAERTLPDGEGLPPVADVVAADLWQAAIAAHRELTVI